MNLGQTVFSQLIEHLPHKEFQKCVARYRGDHYLKSFSCWDQFLAMGFAQLTYRESLRDIEACLRSMQSKLYHMGFRGKVSRSTLADANELRDWRIYADFAQVLIGIARPLYADDPFGVELSENLYALDSTTVDLCLSLFPWARFRWPNLRLRQRNGAQYEKPAEPPSSSCAHPMPALPQRGIRSPLAHRVLLSTSLLALAPAPLRTRFSFLTHRLCLGTGDCGPGYTAEANRLRRELR